MAFDLARKGRSVTLFEATERLGGTLWDAPEAVLPRDVLAAGLAQAVNDGVDVRLHTPVTAESLATLRADFDAVYLNAYSHRIEIVMQPKTQEAPSNVRRVRGARASAGRACDLASALAKRRAAI